MLPEKKVSLHPPLEVISSGHPPYHFLFLTGIHGGPEDCVIPAMRHALSIADLDRYMYIPQASPSAVALGTRENAERIDLNRFMLPATSSNEAVHLMEVFEKGSFHVCLDVHGDEYVSTPYLQDSISPSYADLERKWIKTFETLSMQQNQMRGLSVDPLSVLFIAGMERFVRHVNLQSIKKQRGTMREWLLRNRICSRVIVVEFPTFWSENAISNALLRLFPLVG